MDASVLWRWRRQRTYARTSMHMTEKLWTRTGTHGMFLFSAQPCTVVCMYVCVCVCVRLEQVILERLEELNRRD